jgi:hypothetical protein
MSIPNGRDRPARTTASSPPSGRGHAASRRPGRHPRPPGRCRSGRSPGPGLPPVPIWRDVSPSSCGRRPPGTC